MIATILPSSPRYNAWRLVLGTDKVQVRDSPVLTALAGRVVDMLPEPRGQYYLLDVAALDDEQRLRLTRFLSHQWKIAGDVVAKWLDDPAHGVPVLASDVVVVGDLF